MKSRKKEARNLGGRPGKGPGERMSVGRMTIALPPDMARRVREEAERELITYSTFVRLLIVKELRRLDRQRDRESAA